ncbi:unnamed protein product [Phyllotreta striolata]|uniref:GOLD domain-containing protein n=1 Tax=Phyllotreta striolata TaxID=444603 RepID=A0A9P0DWJ2_PHYSR|nr:unnamed protein product [Phyllotreta striolata]
MRLYVFLSIFACITHVRTMEKELTVFVEAGSESCFYQNVNRGDILDLDYQVIDGGHGDLDINFRLIDPTGRILLTDFKRSENNHRHDTVMEGDYRFCFDNSFSSFNTKTVFFELIIEGEDNGQWDSNENIDFENVPKDVIIDNAQEMMNVVRNHLNKARSIQGLLKSTEARDRNLAEENYFKVNTYSFVQLTLMVTVGIIQVIMVKSLFDSQSRVNKFWKNFSN